MTRLRHVCAAGVLFAVAAFGQRPGMENVIIRAAKPYDKVIAAVEARGGRVVRRFKYIDALAVEAPMGAMMQLPPSSGAISVHKDSLVRPTPTKHALEMRTLGDVSSMKMRVAAIQPLSAAELHALSASGGDTIAGFSADNSLLGLAPLFQDGKHGEGVIVAILDSGIRPQFQHMPGAVIGGEDLVGDGLGWSNEKNDGHGTFVAGMIAAHVGWIFDNNSSMVKALNAYAPGTAKPYNDTQSMVPMAGTAPYASIYMLRIFPADDSGTPDSRTLAAMERVIELRELYDAGKPGGVNIKVCNMSLGGPVLDPGNNPEDLMVDAMLSHDIVPVVAAGNSGPAPVTLGKPATSHSALVVGGVSFAANERITSELQLGAGQGALYRPYAGPLMYFASSRGPQANGEVRPHVVANGHFNFAMGEGDEPRGVTFVSGTSGAAPMVAGVAAVLRQAYPAATARQVRNAIILSANPNFVHQADVLDQGHGFVDAAAAARLLAAGLAPDTVEQAPEVNRLVQVNVEQNSSLRAMEGYVSRTFHLKPGQRDEIVYRVAPNTSQVIVALTNFVAGPAEKQNQLSGDTLSFGVHNAQTSDYASEGNYVSELEHIRTGTKIIDNPEPGLMRIAVNGSWRNAGDVSVHVTVFSTTEPVRGFTARGEIEKAQTITVPFSVPAGTKLANVRLVWKGDWGHVPAADLDLYLVSPAGKVNNDGATENDPEYVTVQDPEPGNWVAVIKGFDIPAGTDKYELRIELDGKVLRDRN